MGPPPPQEDYIGPHLIVAEEAEIDSICGVRPRVDGACPVLRHAYVRAGDWILTDADRFYEDCGTGGIAYPEGRETPASQELLAELAREMHRIPRLTVTVIVRGVDPDVVNQQFVELERRGISRRRFITLGGRATRAGTGIPRLDFEPTTCDFVPSVYDFAPPARFDAGS